MSYVLFEPCGLKFQCVAMFVCLFMCLFNRLESVLSSASQANGESLWMDTTVPHRRQENQYAESQIFILYLALF